MTNYEKIQQMSIQQIETLLFDVYKIGFDCGEMGCMDCAERDEGCTPRKWNKSTREWLSSEVEDND